MTEKELVQHNSEILYLYDAQMCNPNGDMDNNNKPRMDYSTYTNIVTDVRLKRYIRDYFESSQGEAIFITNKAKDAEDRNKTLKDEKKKHIDLIDVRLFGAVTAEKKTVEGHYTGPVQFNWGYSLHPVELVDSNTITSSFSSQVGIGKDYRLYYSLLAFNGSINANVGEKSSLTNRDIMLLDKAMLEAIPLARTRTKIGQFPRFYLRVILKDKTTFLKDMRSLIKVCTKDNIQSIRSISDYVLDISALNEYLTRNKDKIDNIIYWKEDDLTLSCKFDLGDIKISELSL